jgi:hypothetical protein
MDLVTFLTSAVCAVQTKQVIYAVDFTVTGKAGFNTLVDPYTQGTSNQMEID